MHVPGIKSMSEVSLLRSFHSGRNHSIVLSGHLWPDLVGFHDCSMHPGGCLSFQLSSYY
jgi:hypothetical protein